MPGPINRNNSPLWTPPARKVDGFDVRSAEADDSLLRARTDLRIGRQAPQVSVSAFTEDPNAGRPSTLHFLESEFSIAPPGRRGLVGSHVHVDMDIKPEHGDWLFEEGRPELAATTTFVAASTLKTVSEEHLGMSIAWGEGDSLRLSSEDTDSVQLNAAYDPINREIVLGHAVRAGVAGNVLMPFNPLNPANNLANVPDVVAHEAGHAIFDHFKPTTALVATQQNSEQAAINEGLADAQAFLVGFRNTDVLSSAMRTTQRDLSLPNALSDIGDSVGEVLGAAQPALRSMRNTMKYEPGKVYEVHDGGNLINGTTYDLFVGNFKERLARGDDPHLAALTASQVAGDLMLNALKFTRDDGGMGFKDYAQGLVLSDLSMSGGKHLELLQQVLADRNLLTPDELNQTVAQYAAWQKLDLRAPRDVVVDGDRDAAMKLLPKLRETFGLGDVPLTLSRVERDGHGQLQLVFFQPRVNKEAERSSPVIWQFGKVDRDALLSQGAFSITFDAQGKVAGVFNDLNTSTNVSIDGVMGDGQRAPTLGPALTAKSASQLAIADNFSHLVR